MASSEISAAAALLRRILGPPPSAPTAAGAPLAQPTADLPAEAPTHAGRIERALEAACRRTGALGGLVADADGLLLASVRADPAGEHAPVTAALLGEALARAQLVLGATGAQQASLRLGGAERLVLRRLEARGCPYNLLLRFPATGAEPPSLDAVVAALAGAIAQDAPAPEPAP